MVGHKKPWQEDVPSIQEDEALRSLVAEHGSTNWSLIATLLKTMFGIKGRYNLPRSGKQCRERYVGYLTPAISDKEWSADEVKTLLNCHEKLGNRWTEIAQHLPGRSANAVKNLFYGTVRRNLRRYNRHIPIEDRLKGSVNQLLADPDMRPFLLDMYSPSICTRPRRTAQLTGALAHKPQQLESADNSPLLMTNQPRTNEMLIWEQVQSELEGSPCQIEMLLDTLMASDQRVLGENTYDFGDFI